MKKNENGNVLFIIIVAIGLLAALMISLSESERYEDTIDDEKINLQVQELYEYGHKLEKALYKVMLQNGCEISEVSFDHPDLESYGSSNHYANPLSPADEHCHIFEPEGGGLKYQIPPKMSVDIGSYEYVIVPRFAVIGVGTDTGNTGADLLLQTVVPYEACLQINRDQNIVHPSRDLPLFNHWARMPTYASKDTFPTPDFSGGEEGFENFWQLGRSDDPNMHPVIGHKTGCYENDNDGFYSFYHVILAR